MFEIDRYLAEEVKYQSDVRALTDDFSFVDLVNEAYNKEDDSRG